MRAKMLDVVQRWIDELVHQVISNAMGIVWHMI